MNLRAPLISLTAVVLTLTACGGGSSGSAPSVPNGGATTGLPTMMSLEEKPNSVNRSTTLVDTDNTRVALDADDSNPTLPLLTWNLRIGSTIVKGEQNPY